MTQKTQKEFYSNSSQSSINLTEGLYGEIFVEILTC